MTEYDEKKSRESGAGEMLRAARKEAGRSLGEIAAELHINEAHLRSIENDQFDDISSPTFVKGYIRAYARVLELDPDPVMRAYLKVSGPGPQWKASVTVDEPVNDKNKQMAVYAAAGVAALVGIVLVVWLFTRSLGDAEIPVSEADILKKAEQELPVPVKVGESSANLATSDLKADQQSADPTGVEPGPDVPGDAPVEATVAEPTVATPLPEAKQNEAASAQPKNAEASQSAVEAAKKTTGDGVGSPKPQDKTAAAETPQKESPKLPDQAKLDGKDTIKFTFTGESWLNVQNANKERLALGNQKEGSVKEVVGTAPFRVFLGNALNVKIEFNGKPFDATRFRRDNNTARFTLKNP